MSDPVYNQHFVAFFDILGFSDIVSADMTDFEAADKIRLFHQAFSACEELYQGKWSWETDAFSLKMFSDCVCASVPAKHANVDAFFQKLAYLQAIFAENRVMMRGAITVGRHYIDNQMIFSEALVEAYNLEHATRQPRVVVSDRLKEFLTLEHDFQLEKDTESEDRLRSASFFRSSYVMRDPVDGKLFLDYMNFMPAGDHLGHTRLVRHREWIVNGLAEHQNDDNPNIYKKFAWIRDYHNEWCSMFEAHRADLSEFLIDDSAQ